MSYEERTQMKRRLALWRYDFLRRVWPHTQPAITAAQRSHLQMSTPPRDVKFFIAAKKGVVGIRKQWYAMPQAKRRDRWANVMMSAMQFYPHRVCEALEATFEEGITPYYAVADVISFLVRWANPGKTGLWKADPRIQRWGKEREMARKALPHLLIYLLENSTPTSQRFRQWTLYRIINLADAETAGRLSQALLNHRHPLHPYTRFQIADRLARDVRLKYMALEHLEAMVTEGKTDVNSRFSQALATAIMSFPNPDKGNQLMAQMRAEISERILGLGLTPNLYHYTVMIRGLCENNDFETAWKIYEMLLDHKHAPDKYLYSTLLNGAKLTGKLGLVHRVVASLPHTMFDSRVIRNDLLSAILTSAIIEARAKGIKPPRIIPAFPPMVAVYAKFYKLEKLQRLIPIDLNEIVATSERFTEVRRVNWRFMREWEQMIMPMLPRTADKLFDPTPDTLAIMVLGFLKSIETKYQIMGFYTHFQMLLSQGDQVACELCRNNGSAIHDFVLKAALEWEGMLRVSLDILSDMLRGKESRERFREGWKDYVREGEGGKMDWPCSLARKINLGKVVAAASGGGQEVFNLNPSPSVYSWSIILNGAMYHRQIEQGVRIMKLMREHGVEPNEVTWNSLIRGFARLQRTAATVTAMKRMEEAGFKADEFTMRAFSGLVDKEGALRMMEGMLEDMKRVREEREWANGGGSAASVEGPKDGSEQVVDMGPGTEEVLEYDRIVAQNREEGDEMVDWEGVEWEDGMDEEEVKAFKVVADGLEGSIPAKKEPQFEDEGDQPLTIGMEGPRSIPKPKMKYFG